jgi:hypothetical protein
MSVICENQQQTVIVGISHSNFKGVFIVYLIKLNLKDIIFLKCHTFSPLV